jgi:prepilin-type N-terminal cleavage/methylation domain-containing protein/prepilin-type processing-associated H-X9-DG protein
MVKNRVKAFTLIELLVVISIIGLLVSILLPALGAARKAATSTVCLSQLRQIGLGVQMYANDFNDWTPISTQNTNRVFPIPRGTTPRSTQGSITWEHQLGGKLVDWKEDQFPGADWVDKASYLSTTKMFFDPAFEGVHATEWWGDDPNNPYRAGYTWEFWNPEEFEADKSHPVIKYDLGTARTSMNPANGLVTCIGYKWWRVNEQFYDPPAHDNQTNVLWLGGHAGHVSQGELDEQVAWYERLTYLQQQGGGAGQ